MPTFVNLELRGPLLEVASQIAGPHSMSEELPTSFEALFHLSFFEAHVSIPRFDYEVQLPLVGNEKTSDPPTHLLTSSPLFLSEPHAPHHTAYHPPHVYVSMPSLNLPRDTIGHRRKRIIHFLLRPLLKLRLLTGSMFCRRCPERRGLFTFHKAAWPRGLRWSIQVII